MSEQIPQHANKSGEQRNTIPSKEHHERLQEHRENAAEKAGKQHQHEQASVRHEVHEHAVPASEYSKPQSEKRQPLPVNTKADKERGFNTIMHHARAQMSKPEQTFSKFIHAPVVEKTSEVLGKTVARPSGIAGAAIAACIGLLSVYSVAKYAGFQLSGSEMPFLLIIGFAAGLFIEWAFKSVRAIFFAK
jgi:F0F1-type ATP synthase membrane subunit b/b'